MRVLIAGGGVAALEAALGLRELAAGRVDVELVAPEPQFTYRPLAVAEPFSLGEAVRFDLAGLASAAGASYSPGRLVRVDAEQHRAGTAAGASLEFDVLLVACGTTPVPAVRGAIPFRGPSDTGRFRDLLQELRDGRVERVALVVPSGAVWSLPMYELALMTADWLEDGHQAELRLVTPEAEPLQLFGRRASDAVRTLLEERGIAIHTGAFATELADGHLHLIDGGSIPADRAVALPRLRGPRIDGLPQTIDGFLPIDVGQCRVEGLSDVFAAGDITTFPVKQGGIATQQADAAAETIAMLAGAELEPTPFRPVLRGLLLTGREPRYLREEFAGSAGETSVSSPEPLWWPPAKIVGRYLAPFLAARAGLESPSEPPATSSAVSVEIEIEPATVDRLAASQPPLERGVGPDEEATVAESMLTKPLVVAPEDTLGEVAEQMTRGETDAALVSDFGRLIGIVTPRDVLHAFAARAHPSDARVRDWMTADPIVVSERTAIEAALTVMAEYGVDQLPVLDNDDRPTGLLTLEAAARQARLRSGIGLGF